MTAAVGTVATIVPADLAAASEETVLVKVDGRFTEAKAEAIAARRGATLVRSFPQVGWIELSARRSGASPRSAGGLRASARRDKEVAGTFVAPEGFQSQQAQPNDSWWNGTIDGTTNGQWHFTKAGFQGAWDIAQGTKAMTVAVIDQEFDTDNPDLSESITTAYNLAKATGPAYHTAQVKGHVDPDGYHGSHVAGLAAASTNNGKGVSGACWGCGLMVLKVGNDTSGTDTQLIADELEALTYAADHGARVVNMSFGGTAPAKPLEDGVNYARSKGVILVASGGNNQQVAPGATNYPATYPGVIGVGNTDPNDAISSTSNIAAHVDVTAPGGPEILSTTDGNDSGGALALPGQPGVYVGNKGGTSMAAPIVAGLVGLMLVANPNLNEAEVTSLLQSTAKDLGAPGLDTTYGAGRIQADKAVAAAKAYVRPVATPDPPVVPKPPVDAGDKTGPKVGLKGGAKLTKKGLKLTVSCAAGENVCIGKATAKVSRVPKPKKGTSSVTVGSASFSLEGGKTKALTIKVGKKAVAQLKKWKSGKLAITIRAKDQAKNETVKVVSSKVKPSSAIKKR